MNQHHIDISEMIQKPVISEAYRLLRTNIQYMMSEKSIKTIMLSSAKPDEGKTVTSANLAAVMAQSGLRILLVDADLRRPSLHTYFNVDNQAGLSNIIEHCHYNELIKVVEEYDIDLITSGPKPPNPSELLGFSRTKAFLSQVSEEYDLIIIDSPPVLPVTDAVVLSQYVDGVILVVRHGKCTFEEVAMSRDNLAKVNARILGAVINNVSQKHFRQYEYY